MTCFAIAIVEMYPSFDSPYCHPEEGVRPARDSLAGRLTKDLLQHRLIPKLLALNRRNRRHVCAHKGRPYKGQGESRQGGDDEEAIMRVGQTFLSACIALCRRWVRANVIGAYLALRTAEQTGDSSAALRMTCFAIAIVEMYPSFDSPYCHPEEDVRPARESSAGRLTKDLPRHRMIPSLLALNRRNRRHVCAHTVRPRWRVC